MRSAKLIQACNSKNDISISRRWHIAVPARSLEYYAAKNIFKFVFVLSITTTNVKISRVKFLQKKLNIELSPATIVHIDKHSRPGIFTDDRFMPLAANTLHTSILFQL